MRSLAALVLVVASSSASAREPLVRSGPGEWTARAVVSQYHDGGCLPGPPRPRTELVLAREEPGPPQAGDLLWSEVPGVRASAERLDLVGEPIPAQVHSVPHLARWREADNVVYVYFAGYPGARYKVRVSTDRGEQVFELVSPGWPLSGVEYGGAVAGTDQLPPGEEGVAVRESTSPVGGAIALGGLFLAIPAGLLVGRRRKPRGAS